VVDPKTLGELELFVGLPGRALEAIAAIAEKKRYAPGEIIFSPERASEWAFLLLQGSVRLTVHASSLPEPVTLASLETPGQDLRLLHGRRPGHHNSSAEAVTAVKPWPSTAPLPRLSRAGPGRLCRDEARRLGHQPPAGHPAAASARDDHRLRTAAQHHPRELGEEDP
jgi:hypothetical protein